MWRGSRRAAVVGRASLARGHVAARPRDDPAVGDRHGCRGRRRWPVDRPASHGRSDPQPTGTNHCRCSDAVPRDGGRACVWRTGVRDWPGRGVVHFGGNLVARARFGGITGQATASRVAPVTLASRVGALGKLAGLVVGAVVCGLIATRSAKMVTFAGIAIAYGAISCLLLGMSPYSRRAVSRVLLWLAALAPLAVVQSRTVSEVQAASVSKLAVAQALVPLALLVLACALRPVAFLPLRKRELLLAGFLLLSLSSAFWSVDARPTVLKALQLILEYAILLVLVRNESAVGLMSELAVVVFALVASALVGWLVSPHAAFASIDGTSPLRLRGLFPAISPDLLGFLGAISVVLVAGRVGPAWMIRRWVQFAFLFSAITVLLLSRARTGIVLLAVGMLLFMFLTTRRRALLIVLGAPFAFAVASVFLAVSNYMTNFVTRGQTGTAFSSLTGRTALWRTAISFWRRQPWLGYGYYSGHRVGVFATLFQFQTNNIDNVWLETLLDLGIVGAVALGVFVVVSGAALLQGARHSRVIRQLVPALFIMCVISSVVNPSLVEPSYSLIVFGVILLLPTGLDTRLARPRTNDGAAVPSLAT